MQPHPSSAFRTFDRPARHRGGPADRQHPTVPPTSPNRRRVRNCRCLRTAHQNVAPAETAAPLAAVARWLRLHRLLRPAAAPAAVAPPRHGPAGCRGPASRSHGFAGGRTASGSCGAAGRCRTAGKKDQPRRARHADVASQDPARSRRSAVRPAVAGTRCRGTGCKRRAVAGANLRPLIMGTMTLRNTLTDPELARTWYQRAAQLGSRTHSGGSANCSKFLNPGTSKMRRLIRLALVATMMVCGFAARAEEGVYDPAKVSRQSQGDLPIRIGCHQAGAEREHGRADLRHDRRHLCAVRRRPRLRAR